jgi:GTP cyclohydrolase II
MILGEAVQVPLPTPFGSFEVHAFESESSNVHLALVHGDLGDGHEVLVRLHSECLTGDALGSLRCDCGIQLREGLRTIASEGRGVLVYTTGHEGRGVGLINKLRAYVAQDAGADTVDANVVLGLPVDARDYSDAAAVLERLGVKSIRLLTNNPRKVTGLRSAGTEVGEVVPLATAPHHRNVAYLRTKAARLGHGQPMLRPAYVPDAPPPADAIDLLGAIRPPVDRPYVVLKYAQSLDGRIATVTGDSKWISSEPERRLSHALRAACDAVLVGVETVIRDQPQLTVRLVPGASPTRVVLDSDLRIPDDAPVLGPDAATTIITTERSDPAKRATLRAGGARVDVVSAAPDGRVDLPAALATLRAEGVQSLLVEGGGSVITSLLAAGLVDRLIVAVAPLILGRGVEAVDGLGVHRVADGVHLEQRSVVTAGDDVVLAWDVTRD